MNNRMKGKEDNGVQVEKGDDKLMQLDYISNKEVHPYQIKFNQ